MHLHTEGTKAGSLQSCLSGPPAQLGVGEVSDVPPGRPSKPGSYSGLGSSPGFFYLHWGLGTSHFTP